MLGRLARLGNASYLAKRFRDDHARMAGSDGSADPYCLERRTNHAATDRRSESLKPSPRSGIQFQTQRQALGQAEAEAV